MKRKILILAQISKGAMDLVYEHNPELAAEIKAEIEKLEQEVKEKLED